MPQLKKWKLTAIILCCYGLLKELKPSEFFLTEYLINHKNFTKDVIVHEAYPLSTYTYFCTLPFIFLFTDYLKYRPIILLESISFVLIYVLLIWSTGLLALKFVRVLHGIGCAAEIAYLTYIYAKVDKAHYKKVTSYTHSAILIGNLIASIISQVLISFDIMSFHDLNFISLAGTGAALIPALFLPTTRESVYFNRKQSIFQTLTVPIHSIFNTRRRASQPEPKEEQKTSGPISNNVNVNASNANNNAVSEFSKTLAKLPNNAGAIPKENFLKGKILKDTESEDGQVQIVITNQPNMMLRLQKARRYLWKHFKEAYSNTYVLKWSIWWALATAIHLQVIEYYEALWEEIAPEQDHNVYNGAVNAIQFALSAALALTVGILHIHWFKWGESVLCVISIIQGISLIWMASTEYIMLAYALYIVYRTMYQVLITVASAEVAEKISDDSHGLIFGFNTFLAVAIQTILTLLISDHVGLALDIRPEFLVYGCYYVVLGFAFIFVAIYIFSRHGCIQLSWKVPQLES